MFLVILNQLDYQMLQHIIQVKPRRVLAFAVALELLPGQVWAAEGLGR